MAKLALPQKSTHEAYTREYATPRRDTVVSWNLYVGEKTSVFNVKIIMHAALFQVVALTVLK